MSFLQWVDRSPLDPELRFVIPIGYEKCYYGVTVKYRPSFCVNLSKNFRLSTNLRVVKRELYLGKPYFVISHDENVNVDVKVSGYKRFLCKK